MRGGHCLGHKNTKNFCYKGVSLHAIETCDITENNVTKCHIMLIN